MKTSPTNKKIRELITMVKEQKLIPRPEFQRRLVWSRDDKNHFIDSVLQGFPFPEIYLADGEVNLETSQGTQLLVDGLQRVSTLVQYFDGDSNLPLTIVPPYKDLGDDQKKEFLQYDVAVRDLGSISKAQIIEAFKRLNATKYSLLDIEVNNALYSGKMKSYCDKLAAHQFFTSHNVFNALDYKRMGDLRYALSLVGTMMHGYFNRDDEFEDLLSRYNDDFPLEQEINTRAEKTIAFIEECGIDNKSRAWKKADLFTLFVEIDRILNLDGTPLTPSFVIESLSQFYNQVESSSVSEPTIHSIYYKAALQASNDRINRLRRGVVIESILLNVPEPSIMLKLKEEGLA
ncbi:DUF262 domain-containing protein [Pseudomonas sp. Y5-11]|jgi:hypothetical protein|uniref:DUF262 domain-containing protein n=1 Tax=Pseudomonas TaxID=286 RepID=UPI00067E4D6A|nr:MULTISPECIES: DUF262 domain-containing protein [Pseudomonas]ULN81112.1 DUF262 domain-containing protein [Pseudomonas sp. Y5-11]